MSGGFGKLRPKRAVAVDETLRLAPADTTDHLARINQARNYEASLWAAVVKARDLTEKAYARLGDADPALYDIEGNAWMQAQEGTPDTIEADRLEGRQFMKDNDGDEADLVALEATSDLARELLPLLAELRTLGPEAPSDFDERLAETETLADAEAKRKRVLDRHVAAEVLRGLLATYGRTVVQHLASWPEDERDTEEEALRDLVLGEAV